MPKPIRLLHFADAHIDIANYGRHDPNTALPIRVMDFLRSLDQIIDHAIDQQVDLVIFAGDAYKDRNPQPTFQREWGRRIMRLSAAKIPTVLLVGNHDVSPASGRAHTLHEFATLSVPHIHIADRIERLTPDQLGLPVQILTVPWVSRSQLMTRSEMAGKSQSDLFNALEARVTEYIKRLIAEADPDLPLIMTAHASVQGAMFGSERQVMLGQELVLPAGIVKDNRLDYVALGHIHKHQSLNDSFHPPVVYPGSIERVDFGELREDKGFVMADVARGDTQWQFHKLNIRRFENFRAEPQNAETFMAEIMRVLPDPEAVEGAICRLQLTYPRDWEALLDEATLAKHFDQALNFQLQKNRYMERRARLGDTASVETLTPAALLNIYWRTSDLDEDEAVIMQKLAHEVLPIGAEGAETNTEKAE